MKTPKDRKLMTYLKWPFFIGIIPVILTAAAFFIDRKTGLIMLAATVVYFAAAVIVYAVNRRRFRRDLTEFGAAYGKVQTQLLRDTPVPYALCAETGEIFWSNPAFMQAFAQKQGNTDLIRIFPAIEKVDWKKQEVHVSFEDRKYILSASRAKDEEARGLLMVSDNGNHAFYNICMIDETDTIRFRDGMEEEKAVQAVIYFDNYEEILNDVEFVRRSLLSALLERKMNQYFGEVHGVIRKVEKDRYYLTMPKRSLRQLEADNFSILEEIKSVSIGEHMPVTISIGAGLGFDDYDKNYDAAQSAIDMALGRGGDQAVVKDGDDVKYFGGKAKSTEHSTRVKARVKAQALKELIERAEAVIVMGHPIGDLDCIGGAIGVYRAAKCSGKRCYIIADNVAASVRPLIDQFRNDPEYEEDMFISKSRALDIFKQTMLLVVLDTNRPSYTECPEILEQAAQVVVMDHHRQGRETIEQAVLAYVEPYASSVSEMVAEMVQYYGGNLKLLKREADALYAGIVMDTNNFADNSGVRTFEAAAFLRRSGADVSRVRKLFRENREDYMLRAEIVRSAEVFRDKYIIGKCPENSSSTNRTVIAAQAANELLGIKGIAASFVATEYEGKIYLSARSIDEMNVQILMESLGGGGHLSIAGAQFTDATMEEVIDRLKAVIVKAEEKQ